jgi:phage baseplate assembly protein W
MTKKFIGLQYPLVKTPRGILSQKNGIDQIKADLLQLILTNPGERVMLPEYGVPLRSMIFEPNDVELERNLKKIILDAIERWEPRIQVSGIEVYGNFPEDNLDSIDSGDDREHIIGVTIAFYDPQNISEVNELKIELPLNGA